jgi:hypothetical protein
MFLSDQGRQFCYKIMDNLCKLMEIQKSMTTPYHGQVEVVKVNHLIILDKIGQLAPGMTYIRVQLPLNITTMYHQSKILKFKLHLAY